MNLLTLTRRSPRVISSTSQGLSNARERTCVQKLRIIFMVRERDQNANDEYDEICK